MKFRIRTGLAGLLIAVVVAPVAGAADVTVRAEGASQTVVKQIKVPATGSDVTKQGVSCPGNSAGGALDRAVSGDWDGTAFSFGLSVDRIRAETLTFDSGKYWAFDVNNASAPVGVCDYTLQDGDEILFYNACATATDGCSTGKPLDLIAPERVTVGKPFKVRVLEYDDFQSPPPSVPAAGATVRVGSEAADTGADGTATATIAGSGATTVTATKGTQVRDSVTYRCTQAGACVRTAPAPYSIPDTTAPSTTIKAPKGQFAKGKGPRRLRASVAEAGGLDSVRLALTRKNGKTCSTFDADSERFKKAKCGARALFAVDAQKSVSFLLPARLKAGKYTFVALSADVAGNTEPLVRGRNRVVFRVR